ncbi:MULTISPECIES: hypothetical protein [unclassified Rhizobium]|uniref:hypothetical protein n=1 Tax=unclassified Rhizobium TaxID=2613769 RepID=UPI00160877DA|nr:MULTISPECIES: hypothetical protein [unclassified Rhizobium]MBB3541378.1 hypothetical protein [Rhizobium sp. BK399]MCS3740103.1 hypothetical protein [Rhizobium sp. BK661]
MIDRPSEPEDCRLCEKMGLARGEQDFDFPVAEHLKLGMAGDYELPDTCHHEGFVRIALGARNEHVDGVGSD